MSYVRHKPLMFNKTRTHHKKNCYAVIQRHLHRSNYSQQDFLNLTQPTSEEGYVDQTQSSSTNKPKSSRLDLAGRSGMKYRNYSSKYRLLWNLAPVRMQQTFNLIPLGFGNPFGYLMGNGGLCGGRGDNKASNTSEASPLPQSNQRYFNHDKSSIRYRISKYKFK